MKKTLTKSVLFRVVAIALGIGALATLSSCNTVNGLGKDLQILGKKMEKQSDQVQHQSNY